MLLIMWVYCHGLLLSDFRYSRGVLSPERHVRTRLYFTSESHVHSLLSILRYGALCDVSYFHVTDKLSLRVCSQITN